MDPKAAVFLELVRYAMGESARWRAWLAEQDPSVLGLRIGEAQIATVGTLLAHVAAVDLMYADTVAGERRSAYEWPAVDSLDPIFALEDKAFGKLVAFLEGAPEGALEQERTLRVRGYRLTASAGKMVAHLLVHGIRHYAQLATALRAAGHAQPWQHDLILADGFGPPGAFMQEATAAEADPSA